MLNVFVSAEELNVELSDVRIKGNKSTVSKLKVGEWFRIDREVIDKSKEEIHRKCNMAGTEGRKLWKRFKKSNKIADKNPN